MCVCVCVCVCVRAFNVIEDGARMRAHPDCAGCGRQHDLATVLPCEARGWRESADADRMCAERQSRMVWTLNDCELCRIARHRLLS